MVLRVVTVLVLRVSRVPTSLFLRVLRVVYNNFSFENFESLIRIINLDMNNFSLYLV